MTEKVDLSDDTTTLPAEDSIPDLSAVLSIDLPSAEPAVFNVQEDNLCTVADLPSDTPNSPEQKVPDFLMSPASVASPSSVSSHEVEAFSPELPFQGQSHETPLAVGSRQPKQRPTPYSRPCASSVVKPKLRTPEQKKRKRAQNKSAATRYRVKKRDEQDGLMTELKEVEDTNTELKEQVTSLTKEIEYLKNLLLEVCKVKMQKQAPLGQCA